MSSSSASSSSSSASSASESDSSSGGEAPQIHIILDASQSTKKAMKKLDGAVEDKVLKFYTKITGKRSKNVSRLMFMCWHIWQIAKDAVKRDWDGILTIHSLSTKDVVEVEAGSSFADDLAAVFKRLFKTKHRGSEATDDFLEVVDAYLDENNPFGVFFYTDGSLSDQDAFFAAYADKADEIVEHGGSDRDFGVVICVASDRAARQLRKLERMDTPLPNGVDLFDVADLRNVATDVERLLEMAADG